MRTFLTAQTPTAAKINKFDNTHIDKNIILYMDGVSKSFDGFKAINDLNLYIDKGELRCIIGPTAPESPP